MIYAWNWDKGNDPNLMVIRRNNYYWVVVAHYLDDGEDLPTRFLGWFESAGSHYGDEPRAFHFAADSLGEAQRFTSKREAIVAARRARLSTFRANRYGRWKDHVRVTLGVVSWYEYCVCTDDPIEGLAMLAKQAEFERWCEDFEFPEDELNPEKIACVTA